VPIAAGVSCKKNGHALPFFCSLRAVDQLIREEDELIRQEEEEDPLVLEGPANGRPAVEENLIFGLRQAQKYMRAYEPREELEKRTGSALFCSRASADEFLRPGDGPPGNYAR